MPGKIGNKLTATKIRAMKTLALGSTTFEHFVVFLRRIVAAENFVVRFDQVLDVFQNCGRPLLAIIFNNFRTPDLVGKYLTSVLGFGSDERIGERQLRSRTRHLGGGEMLQEVRDRPVPAGIR